MRLRPLLVIFVSYWTTPASFAFTPCAGEDSFTTVLNATYYLPIKTVRDFFIGPLHFTQSHAELFRTDEQKSLRDGFKDFVYSDWSNVETGLFERNATYKKLYEGFWLVKWLECYEWQWYEMTSGQNGFVFRKNIKTELPSPMDWMNLMGYYCGTKTPDGRISLVVDLKITDQSSPNWLRQLANDQAIMGFKEHFKTVDFVLKELEVNVSHSREEDDIAVELDQDLESREVEKSMIIATQETNAVDPITERKVPEDIDEKRPPHNSIFSTVGDLLCSNGFFCAVLVALLVGTAWAIFAWKSKERSTYSHSDHSNSVLFTSNSLA